MYKLSIIIPIYNSEEYLGRCIQSIISQGVNLSDFEIICIDDKSSDRSCSIIKDFKRQYTNISAYYHKKNKKQGAARNLGLQKAKGQFVWFVDSDDYLEENVLSRIFEKLDRFNPDILQFNASKVLMDGKKTYCNFWKNEISGLSGIEYLAWEMQEEYSCRIVAAWSKIFKKSFLYDSNLLFEEGVYWEDVVFTLKVFLIAKSVVYIPISVYNYVQTTGSDMRSYYNGKKIADSIRFCIEAATIAHLNILNEKLRLYTVQKYIPTILKYKEKIKDLPYSEFLKFDSILHSIENKEVLKYYMEEHVYTWLIDRMTRKEVFETSKNNL